MFHLKMTTKDFNDGSNRIVLIANQQMAMMISLVNFMNVKMHQKWIKKLVTNIKIYIY